MDIQHTARTVHTFVVTHEPGETVRVDSYNTPGFIHATDITVEVTVEGSALTRVGTSWAARGYHTKADGTPSRRPATSDGRNMGRLPIEVRLAVAEALREAVGHVEDPHDQLNGTAP